MTTLHNQTSIRMDAHAGITLKLGNKKMEVEAGKIALEAGDQRLEVTKQGQKTEIKWLQGDRCILKLEKTVSNTN